MWRKAALLPLPSLRWHLGRRRSVHCSAGLPAPRCSTAALAQVIPPVGLLRRGSILPFGCETQAADVVMWLLPYVAIHKLYSSHSNAVGEQQPSPIFPACPYKFTQGIICCRSRMYRLHIYHLSNSCVRECCRCRNSFS